MFEQMAMICCRRKTARTHLFEPEMEPIQNATSGEETEFQYYNMDYYSRACMDNY